MLSVVDVYTQKTTTIHSPFTVTEQNLPLIISVPHSGRYLLSEYASQFHIGRGMWIDIDWHTADVYPTALGSSLVAQLAPQQVNFNRSWEKWEATGEKDPLDMISLLPGEIVLKTPYSIEARQRLRAIADAYHQHLEHLIATMKTNFGYALVLDCHSMSSIALANTPDAGDQSERADFVVGTLEGNSADPKIISCFTEVLTEHSAQKNLRVVCDDPYKGGYITQRHADPKNDVHVLQLEIKKKLYMHEGLNADEPNAFMPNTLFSNTQTILHNTFLQTRDLVQQMLS
jgi:N-formylglutamate deformylase